MPGPTEPLSCGHRRGDRATGCRVCTLYATHPAYRALWDGEPIPEEADCRFRGEPLTGYRRNALRLSSANWSPCSHPERPKGEYVCPCRGCGPTCSGYEPASIIE